MTEEIIVNDVNVAGCEHYTTMEDCDGIHDLCEQLDDYCSIKKNCYYKQLKRAENTVNECHKYLAELEDKIESLEQENKDLKDNNNHLQAIIDDGRAENKRFREENKELKSETLQWKQIKDMANNNKYRSALEEIRENLVKLKTNDEDDFTYEYSKIEDKINEVLNLS